MDALFENDSYAYYKLSETPAYYATAWYNVFTGSWEFGNRDPEVIALGYTRLSIIFSGYLFSLLYELMSGYLRGFGISLAPAVLTTLGVCGICIFWVQAVFPRHANFQTLMLVYPLSLFVTAVLILAALIVCRPTTRMKKQEKKEISA